MNSKEFRQYAHQMVDWMADYFEQIEDYPVKAQVEPKEIYNQLPEQAPLKGEEMSVIFKDFQDIILPGITHWQHPSFFAYFPANTSFPSILGEMLTATLGTQCMIWDTSPAAAELEERVMNWLRDLMGIPSFFDGVIQDTASTATLTAILSAREKATNFDSNQNGITQNNFRVYCSTETHSSIEKAVKIAGLGKNNLVKIPVDAQLRMQADALENAIQDDLKNGYRPICIVAAIGTTGTTAIDPLKEITTISQKFNIWLHVDAAYAGSALLLPEFQWMIEGIELVDSFVFNPHKWLLTNFDCSVYFIKDKESLLKTFEVLPEYLKTASRGIVNDYRDWGVPLGRRFRALKLWFVLRNYGVEGLQKQLRAHISLAQALTRWIQTSPDFELLAPTTLNLVCFRYHPKSIQEEERLNVINKKILDQLNKNGRMYLTHTKINKKYTLRIVVGQTFVEAQHVQSAWEQIQEIARKGA
ncbi:MAG: Aromatic-L-amino-acid decarboxylase (EC [uncultured Aureispira sp.]|uniref:Aromatic-L-amino-acid decarboxylase (EC) n=1 Tax=uncultured Aureispira sp. TaxID=1331704 RepID=A0A6S6SLR9_9BACT|nr:MAG: Aromatic-L-amino-acid decarboxylase (EC [uncultured Aureispira sp.]